MKRLVISFLLLTIIFQTGFQCMDDFDENTRACSTPATVVDLRGLDGCGFVFELEDGSRLEPVITMWCGTPPVPEDQEEDPLKNFEWVAGKKVFIKYEIMQGMASICIVGETVKITCISEVQAPSDH
jgi:hypothetical protein